MGFQVNICLPKPRFMGRCGNFVSPAVFGVKSRPAGDFLEFYARSAANC
jgi:hypothetical protein